MASSVRVYEPDLNSLNQNQAWTHRVIDKNLHVTHNFDHFESDLYIAGAEGIVKRTVTDGEERDARIITPENSTPSTRGAGEVRKGKNFIAAIEPFHGNDLVVYTEQENGEKKWTRHLLTDQLAEGHALGVSNLFGSDAEEVIVGWRKPNAAGEMGIQIHYQTPDHQWQNLWVDKNEMAAEDLQIADLNGDGKIDIIAAGQIHQQSRDLLEPLRIMPKNCGT